jgi:hypothetical protein
MAGLVPAIHVFAQVNKDVDARAKRGHDENREVPPCNDGYAVISGAIVFLRNAYDSASL